jgi:hypothetical protein
MSGKGRKKPRFAQRNLALVALFVVPLIGLTVAVQAFRREVVLILPAEHEVRLEKRNSPDNALPILSFAIKALPAKPGSNKDAPSYAPEQWWDERGGSDGESEETRAVFEREPDYAKLDAPSLGKLCWIDRPDDDPALAQYILGCLDASYLLYSALEKPFCICTESPRYHSKTYDGSLMQLGRSVAAFGRVRFTELPNWATVQPLMDAIRLARLLSREDDMLAVSQSIEGPALQQFRYLAAHTDQAPLLAEALDRLGPGYLPRRDVLRALWLDLDDQIGRQNADRGLGVYRRRVFQTFAFSYEIQRLAVAMKPRQEELLQVADRPPAEVVAWLCSNIGGKRGPRDLGKSERRVFLALHRAAELSRDFAATRIVLALELYKAETGQYPASLDKLAPKYIADVPQDPYTLAPFGYKLSEGKYTVYSFGDDLADNGGDPVRDHIIAGPGNV